MVKGFIQKSDNITQNSQTVFKKGLNQTVEVSESTESVKSVKTAENKSKEIGKTQKSNDLQEIERNNILKLLYDVRLKSIESLKNVDITSEKSVHANRVATKRLLNMALVPLQRNVLATSIAAALTPQVVMAVVVPDIHNDIPMEVYDKLEPLARRYADTDAKLKVLYDKYIKLKANERLPYSPEIAAETEIALSMKYYEDMRKPGLSDEDKKQIDMGYHKKREHLESLCIEDNVDMHELRKQNHSIVVSMVKSDVRLKRMFSYIYDNHAVDLSQIERSYATVINESGRPVTSSVYRVPLGGLVYADGGNSFPYRFGPRNIYTPNMYDDMMFNVMKYHYGKASKAYASEDKLYLKSDDYVRDLAYAYEIKALMIDDGYTEEQARDLIAAVHTRCELYYHTEDPVGIEEWLKEHPEDAEKFKKKEEPVVDPNVKIDLKNKKHIKIKKSDKEDKVPEGHEWTMAPSDPMYESMMRVQDGWELTRPLNDTFTENDLRSIAYMMHDLEYSLNPHSKKYNVESTFGRLLENAEAELLEFLRCYRSEEMNYYKRRIYDTLKIITKTEAPAIDKDNFLVAVRCISGLFTVGDTGGRVHGNISVGPGCFVDDKSGIDNSELSGNVVILMRTSIKGSKISGNGIIVNSDITNCTLNGTFNEYDMRIKMDAEHSSPVHILKMIDLTETFGDYTADESIDIGLKRIKTHGYEYMNRTIEEYINIWQCKHHAKMVFNRNLKDSGEDESLETDESDIVKGQKHFYGENIDDDADATQESDEVVKIEENRIQEVLESKKKLQNVNIKAKDTIIRAE